MHKREQEFLQLKGDINYRDVQFNHLTGGLKATHICHHFDEQYGRFETEAQQVLFNEGNKIILQSEVAAEGIKTPDGMLNDKICELKSVLGTGRNNIKRKLAEALSQGCEHLILYYPDPSLYNIQSIQAGYDKYKGILRKERQTDKLRHVWIIVNGDIIVFK